MLFYFKNSINKDINILLNAFITFIIFIMAYFQIDESFNWIYSGRHYGHLNLFVAFYSDSSKKYSFELTKRESLVHILFGYLLLVFAFANLYQFIYMIDKKSFNEEMNIINSFYFSIITSATIGYGDITPKTYLSKLLVSCEVISSLGYAVFFLASLPEFTKKLQKS